MHNISQRMLTIIFNKFKCWEHLKINVPIGEIVLIKGNSGAGKTTIFQGITWCLYGNVRSVAPNHMEKAKTNVILEFPYNGNIITIDRHKNPNRLCLSYNGEFYEDKVAQSLIDNMFGSYDIWLSSCYIGQNSRNSFLTASNAGKMELLNSIAFHEEDPAIFIDKIDSVLVQKELEYKISLDKFMQDIDVFTAISRDVDVTKSLTKEQIDLLNLEISKCNDMLQKLYKIKEDRNINLSTLSNLNKRLETISIPQINNVNPSIILTQLLTRYNNRLDDMDNIINNLHLVLPLLERRDGLYQTLEYNRKLMEQFATLDKEVNYTNEDYTKSLEIEIKLKNNQLLAQSFNINYNSESIKDIINYYNTILKSQEVIKLKNQRDQLITKLNYYNNQELPMLVSEPFIPNVINIPDYSIYDDTHLVERLNKILDDRGKLKAETEHLFNRQSLLECPKCSCSLRYQGNKLLEADSTKVDYEEYDMSVKELNLIDKEKLQIESEINILRYKMKECKEHYDRMVNAEINRSNMYKEQINKMELENQRRLLSNQQRMKDMQELQEAIKSYEHEISLLPDASGQPLSNAEIVNIYSMIAKLENIKIIEPPIYF